MVLFGKYAMVNLIFKSALYCSGHCGGTLDGAGKWYGITIDPEADGSPWPMPTIVRQTVDLGSLLAE